MLVLNDVTLKDASYSERNDPLLKVSGLDLFYDTTQRTAFREVDLELGAGKIVAVIGPSGCGKSSLLKAIADVQKPTSGEVIWKNGVHPEWAYIFQDPTLLPWKTVQGNVEVPLKLRGVKKSERRNTSEECIRQVLLEDAKDHYPKALSGGMRMRASLARALTLHPELLFLDEPFGALDALTRNQMNELVLKLQRQQGWSALLVTHSVNEAVYLADEILVMSAAPGTISHRVALDLPRDRDFSLQTQSQFQEYVRHIRTLLGEVI